MKNVIEKNDSSRIVSVYNLLDYRIASFTLETQISYGFTLWNYVTNGCISDNSVNKANGLIVREILPCDLIITNDATYLVIFQNGFKYTRIDLNISEESNFDNPVFDFPCYEFKASLNFLQTINYKSVGQFMHKTERLNRERKTQTYLGVTPQTKSTAWTGRKGYTFPVTSNNLSSIVRRRKY